ncbi:MAG: hypothetical protein J6L89_06685 [Clostridia bacterium]|nr:hypothetical protein [Clostridia bacterium]
MKRFLKTALSLSMALVMVFSLYVPSTAVVIAEEKIVEITDEVITEKTGEVSSADIPDFSVYNLVPEGEISESGYQEMIWVDENGDEVVFESTNSNKPHSNQSSSIPSKYSSKDLGYVSGVRNQGGANSCWAFAAVASGESNLLRKGLIKNGDDLSDLSEAHLVWFAHKSLTTDVNDPTFGDGANVGSPYYSGGDWHRSIYTLARGSGFTLEKDYPFYPYNSTYMGNYDESKRYESKATLDEAFLIPNESTDEIKKAVMEYGSVSFAALIVKEYFNGAAYYQDTYVGTNHEMIIVGWDDTYSVDNFRAECKPSNPGAWLVKNSYDTSFGENGYIWISYEEPSLNKFLVQDVSLKNEEESVYQYDGFGYQAMIGVPGYYDGSVANVFTAEKSEAIESVGFYTAEEQDNVTYEISVYKNVTKGGESPVEGGTKFPVVTSGVAKYSGYHKIKLDQVVPISKGETFSVVVRMTVPESGGSQIIIPVEGQSKFFDGAYDRFYSSESGQSFFTLAKNGKELGWSEPILTDENGNNPINYNNVCVKAFTVPDNTLEIRTAEEFNAFAQRVANGESFEGRNINLMADIDFNGGEIIPVGTEKNPFKGFFLGNGYVLKNGVIDSESDYTGVFSVLPENAEISKLGVEDITVNGVYGVGAICGYNEGKIIYCYSTGSVSGEESIGGLVGINAGEISHSYSVCDVAGEYDAGSFIGEDDGGEVTNSYVISSSLDPIYNGYSDGITPLNSKYFANGLAAFYLDEGNINLRKNIWTKRDGKTTFLKSEDEIIYKIDLFDTSDYSSVYVYANSKDSIKELAEAEKPGMTAEIFADSKHKVPYSGVPTANSILYVVWSVDHNCAEHLTFNAGVEATCYTDGNIPYYECECGKLYTDENAENLVTEDEVMVYAYWHPLESLIKTERVEPTHTESGNIEYYTCLLCGDVFEEESCINEPETVVIPATGHNHGDWVTEIEPTCETEGLKVRKCSCGDRIEESIPSLGHSEGETVIESEIDPDCENEGSYDEVVYCTVCNKELSRTTIIIDALGHTEGETVIENEIDPDCENEGSYDEVVYCTVCNEELSRNTVSIDALGHTEGETVIENEIDPDCENEGSYDEVVYCTVCNEELSRNTVSIDALGHSEGKTVIENKVEPDCVNEGSYEEVVYCTVCNKELSRKKITVDAKGHLYKEEVTLPTETEKGYITKTCTVCGESFISEYVDAPSVISATINITSYLSETDEITVEFIRYGESDVCYSFTTKGNNVTYIIESILSGVYTVRISKNNHATREYENVVIKAGDFDFKICPIGDVTGDGRITVVDYNKVLRHVKKTEALTGYELICADVDFNSKINVVDYNKILRHVKKIHSLW